MDFKEITCRIFRCGDVDGSIFLYVHVLDQITGQPQLSEAGKPASMFTQLLSEPQAEMTSTRLEKGELVRKHMHMHILISLCMHESCI